VTKFDHIVQRCTETSLQAADITSSLNISRRPLHPAVAACRETFRAMLIQARVDVALRMLQAPLRGDSACLRVLSELKQRGQAIRNRRRADSPGFLDESMRNALFSLDILQ
jgi:hypothetical protein